MSTPIWWYLNLAIAGSLVQGQIWRMTRGLGKFLEDGHSHAAEEPPDRDKLLKEYDFIIVGAGTAGCVVASRLSENPKWKVLLVEAGGAENFLQDIPMIVYYFQLSPTLNWQYRSVPDERYCLGMVNGQCKYPRGKVMGGSSVLNYMIHTRGNRRDYDKWAAMGNTGWSYRDVLPYFKKMENFSIPMTYDSRYHNPNGNVRVGYAPWHTKISDAILDAGKESGWPEIDYNGPTQVGISRLQVNVRDGVRDSASRAYLHPVHERANLHVTKHSTVMKVLINSRTKAAYGVTFAKRRNTITVRAKKEVILSAGAINTPQLLMLSGVGPKRHLEKLGIETLADLPVGYNLMDHIALGGMTFIVDEPYTVNSRNLRQVSTIREYLNKRSGLHSVPGGCEVVTFVDSEHPQDPDGYPDVELLIQGGSIASDRIFERTFGIKEDLYREVYAPLYWNHTFSIFPMVLRPKSRGRVRLKDSDYRSKPLIYPNYYDKSYDMKTMLKAVEVALNLVNTTALKKIGTRLHDKPLPPCSNFEFASKAYWECVARQLPFTIYHQCGTCKMGPDSDPSAVVDPRLRVKEILGLRVVDASIIPVIPAAHTNAPTYMIAEKGSDMIKEDWGWLVP